MTAEVKTEKPTESDQLPELIAEFERLPEESQVYAARALHYVFYEDDGNPRKSWEISSLNLTEEISTTTTKATRLLGVELTIPFTIWSRGFDVRICSNH